LNTAWTQAFAAPVTAPVAAGDRVFFAETDRHTVHALSAEDGCTLWSRAADGRIDSPPSLCGGLCLFGTRNGLVYCLRTDDGELVWRFDAAPRPRRLFSYEQLESVWPVHGSVLVDDGPSGERPKLYFAAGRSSHLDGGIRLFCLDARTGDVLHRAEVRTGADGGEGVIADRALPDILSLQEGHIFMRDLGLAQDLTPLGQRVDHLYAPGGFLDTTWWHRTYWIYGKGMQSGYGGWPRVGNVVPAGRLLVTDGDELIYGYGRMSYRAGAGHVHPDATKDYRLFAEVLVPEPKPQDKRRGRQPAGRREIVWATSLPFVARSLVLTEDALLVAGGKSLVERPGRHGPGILWIASREDGTKQAECELPAPPVLDGAALTDCGVFLTTLDGTVVGLRSGK
jgi:hypothetical protein